MKRCNWKLTLVSKLMVPNDKSAPLPCKVTSPAPTTGAVFNAKPPPILNVPPVPGAVLNTSLTNNEIASP